MCANIMNKFYNIILLLLLINIWFGCSRFIRREPIPLDPVLSIFNFGANAKYTTTAPLIDWFKINFVTDNSW